MADKTAASGEGAKHMGEHRAGRAAEAPRLERTIYMLKSDKPDAKPDPVKIKTGINDGIFSEIVEGVNENDTLVTGINNPEPVPVLASKGGNTANPLNGMKRF